MTTSDLAAYVLGRRVAVLAPPYRDHDCAFGATRLDGRQIDAAGFGHCTFANVSFKKSVVNNATFDDCIFIGCYFRRAEFVNCRFVGCRFIDCNFNHVAIKTCDFRYATFRSCQIPFAELQHCLPPEPNLREDLARNLFLESSGLGLAAESARYRMEEIRAREANLRAAVIAESQWYREHFDGFARVRAFGQLILSLLNRWLWGYGQNSWTLLRNLGLAGLLIFPIIFHALREGIAKSATGRITVQDLLYFSLENILPAGFQSGIHAMSLGARIAAGAESFVGIVALGLFASYVFRWSLHR